MAASSDMPRQQHYLFAHKGLPRIVFSDPARALTLLTGPMGEAFVFDMWQRLGRELPAEDRVGVAGLGLFSRVEGDATAVVVRMPKAQRVAEAHFVGFRFDKPERAFLFFQKPPEVRCYTLEFSRTLDGGERTVLGQWNARGDHLNHGDGPPADLESFFRAIFAAGREDAD
jgi:hypothetical protein